MKIMLKVGIIFVMVLVLQVPLVMIGGVSDERENYGDDVVAEISRGFGTSQVVVAPAVYVHYTEAKVYIVDNVSHVETSKNIMVIPPEELTINGTIHVEQKKRSIYTAAVYSSQLNMSGSFTLSESMLELLKKPNLTVDNVMLTLMVRDPKGIKGLPSGNLQGEELVFSADRNDNRLMRIIAEIALNTEGETSFEINLPLNGSKRISFVPTGMQNTVNLESDWPHPSFDGEFLPETSTISSTGFSATWMTTWISGSLYNQSLNILSAEDNGYRYPDYDDSEFGVSFIEMVDVYSLVDRSIKYGFLIITLTFLIIFVLEVLTKCRIHPVQYGLVGAALAIFFLLLLSLSEQIPFFAAYALSALACTVLITFYIYFALKNIRHTGIFSGFLIILYVVLYILLNVSDYALLVGSALIFAVLTTVMITTRKLNWYEMS